MEIRKVTGSDDFSAIGDIYSSSWKTAYRGIVPRDYLDALSGDRWCAVLKDDRYDAFVITETGKYIGVSSVCAARDETMGGWGELVSIYLLPEYFGKGYAKPLLDYFLRALGTTGFRSVYLWVLEDNARARKFYEKNGFHRNSGVSNIVIGGKDLTEIRYVRRLC